VQHVVQRGNDRQPCFFRGADYQHILVATLQQKLGDDTDAPRWIATEPGAGLRFLAP